MVRLGYVDLVWIWAHFVCAFFIQTNIAVPLLSLHVPQLRVPFFSLHLMPEKRRDWTQVQGDDLTMKRWIRIYFNQITFLTSHFLEFHLHEGPFKDTPIMKEFFMGSKLPAVRFENPTWGWEAQTYYESLLHHRTWDTQQTRFQERPVQHQSTFHLKAGLLSFPKPIRNLLFILL